MSSHPAKPKRENVPTDVHQCCTERGQPVSSVRWEKPGSAQAKRSSLSRPMSRSGARAWHRTKATRPLEELGGHVEAVVVRCAPEGTGDVRACGGPIEGWRLPDGRGLTRCPTRSSVSRGMPRAHARRYEHLRADAAMF